MDAVIYSRWSSIEQGRGSSPERQRQDCRAHAVANGWRVIDEIEEDGVSAWSGANVATGQLGRFVERVEAGEYPAGVVLLVERLDRLSRLGPQEAFLWVSRITDRGVTIATVDGSRSYRAGGFDLATILEVVVKASVAHEESAKKSDRVGKAWRGKRSRLASGDRSVLTRRVPGWLEVVGSPATFRVIEERAAIVRRVYEDTDAGLGKHTIAKMLNEEGVEPFGRADGWHASYIQKLLDSKAVLGEFQPHTKPRGGRRTPDGDAILDYYPPIIEPGLHASARRSMAARARGVGGRGRRLTNLLSGLARCGSCGSIMTLRAKGRKQRASGDWVNEDYLVCDAYQRGLGCTSHVHHNYGQAESGVLDAILAEALDDAHFAVRDEVRSIENAIADQSRRLQATKAKATTALNIAAETGRAEPLDLYRSLSAEADELEASLIRLDAELVAARGTVAPDEHQRRIAAMRETLDASDEDERFRARARVMAALHDLIGTVRFNADPRSIDLHLVDGRKAYVVADETEPMWDLAVDVT